MDLGVLWWFRRLFGLTLLFRATQGPKLTFLDRRQLATEIFYQFQMQKCGRQKVLTKFFLRSQTQIDRKTLVANFSLENQNEENAFGAAMVIFPQTNKSKYKHADYLYIYHWKPRQTNRTLAICPVSCDCQMFQVNFVVPFGSLFKTIFPFVFCQDDLRVAMLLAQGHNRAAPEPSTVRMLWETADETW